MAFRDDHILVVVHISSTKVAVQIGRNQLDRLTGQGDLAVLSYRARECSWYQLDRKSQIRQLRELIGEASRSAKVESVHSVFISITDESLRANQATGHTDLGQPLTVGPHERDSALARAAHQSISTNRMVLHALPIGWRVTGGQGASDGERRITDPIGEVASHLYCEVLLITIDQEVVRDLAQLCASCQIELEGVLAQPVCLYQALADELPKRHSGLIIDIGARHTHITVHRKTLRHMETHRFGSLDLMQAIAENLAVSSKEAQSLLAEIDVAIDPRRRTEEGQLTLWHNDEQHAEQHRQAAEVVSQMMTAFLRDRLAHLRDLELLSEKNGRIHLVGRAANINGLSSLVADVSGQKVVLGSADGKREKSEELNRLMLVGQMMQAAAERDQALAIRAQSGIRQVATAASGLWSWLWQPLR